MYEINGNLTDIENYNVFNRTIALVMEEFIKMFGSEILTKYPLYIDNCNGVKNANCGPTPIITPVLQQFIIIKLGIAHFGDVANIIYQLSHELCHYVFYSVIGITKPLADEREERICSAMSLIMIKELLDNDTFERHCKYVKELSIPHYRDGYYLAEKLEFKKENIVEIIQKK